MKTKKKINIFSVVTKYLGPFKRVLWLPRWLSSKELACQAGETGLIPGLGRSPGEGNGNPLSCQENPRDWGPDGLPSLGSHRVEHD